MHKAIPDKIRIGYQDVRVMITDSMTERALEDSNGFYHSKRSEIVIAREQDTREIVNTVIHECLHAIFFTYGMREIVDDKEKEEYIVNTLGNGLTQIFLENPDFLEWVRSNLEP